MQILGPKQGWDHGKSKRVRTAISTVRTHLFFELFFKPCFAKPRSFSILERTLGASVVAASLR